MLIKKNLQKLEVKVSNTWFIYKFLSENAENIPVSKINFDTIYSIYFVSFLNNSYKKHGKTDLY